MKLSDDIASAHANLPKRRRRASPGQRELLDKAFEVFVELGFEGASVDAIAAAAGVAKRTLYLRHGDKEGLFRAAVGQAIAGFVVPLDRLRDAERADLSETLLAVGRLLVDNILSADGLRLLHLTNSVAGRMPELAAFNVHKGIFSTMAFLTELLERRIGGQLLWFASAQDAATAFINLVVCGPATWITQGVLLDRDFVDRYVDASVAMYLHGLRQAAASVTPAPPDPDRDPLAAENQQLKVLLAEAVLRIDVLTKARGAAGSGGLFHTHGAAEGDEAPAPRRTLPRQTFPAA